MPIKIRINGVERDWHIGERIEFDYNKIYEILVENTWIDLRQYLDEVENSIHCSYTMELR